MHFPRAIQTDCWRASVWRWLVIITVAAVVGRPLHTMAQSLALPEYTVKAALLYNIAKLIEWPPGAFANAAAPLTLCILGPDPFGEAFRGRTVRGRAVVLKSVAKEANPQECHILFIRGEEPPRLFQLFDRLQDFPVLTVGEHQQFAHAGGIINFIMIENKIRFEINLNAAQHARLKLSSKLLKLGQIVEGRVPGAQP